MSKKKTAVVKKGTRGNSPEPRANPPASSPPPVIAREQGAAAFLDMSKQTLRVMRSRGGGPPFVKLGLRRVGYLLSDLEEWARSRPRFANTTEASLANAPEAPPSGRGGAR
jgi:predicted DNA-binding transcriptional regulator AlpA